MHCSFVGRAFSCLATAALSACFVGCGNSNCFDRYVPAESRARQALEAALMAWQRGGPPVPVALNSVAIEFVDRDYRAGKHLRAFTILGEVPGDVARCFAVLLKLDDTQEEKRVRFVVVGLEPLWVHRYEDFEVLTHWGQCSEEEKPRDDTAVKDQ
jgi:hypothetical protein